MDRDYVYYEYTNSLCNECLKVIPAKIIFKDNKVYLLKHCSEHGEQLELLEHDIEYFKHKRDFDKAGTITKTQTEVVHGCPYDCGLCPNHDQHSCINLVEVEMHDNIIVIGDRAFENATSLESVVVPENVTTLSSNCFNKCTSLKSISLPSTLKTIKYQSFYNCISLEEIEIPKRTTTLEHNVFNGCANLRTVIINGVPELRDWTFQKCKIDKLYLAKSVTVIDPDAFLDATVKEVYYAGSPEQWEIINRENTKRFKKRNKGARARKIFENSTIHFEAENYESPLTPDVNRDSAIDASDASLILAYYAYVMTGGTGTIEEYIASQNS